MKIDGVRRDAPLGIILAEDELGGLLVVLLHLAPVGFALFREFFSPGAVAAGVCFLGLDFFFKSQGSVSIWLIVVKGESGLAQKVVQVVASEII